MEDPFGLVVEACRRGTAEEVRLLLETNPELVEETDSDNRAPLDLACSEGNLEVVRWLVREGGADIYGDSFYCKALDIACAHGHLEVARWLIEEYRINLNQKTHALMEAIHNDHLEVVQWLVREAGDIAIINGYTMQGWTPVHFACPIIRCNYFNFW